MGHITDYKYFIWKDKKKKNMNLLERNYNFVFCHAFDTISFSSSSYFLCGVEDEQTLHFKFICAALRPARSIIIMQLDHLDHSLQYESHVHQSTLYIFNWMLHFKSSLLMMMQRMIWLYYWNSFDA